MFTQSKPRNAFLAIRRRNEQRYDMYDRVSQNNKKLNHNSNWNARMVSIQSRKNVQKNYAKYQEMMHQKVLSRRAKLKEKLEREDEIYRNEILQLQETPSSRRKILEERAKELKQQREERNATFSKRVLQKKFEDESDEIRDMKRRIKTLEFARNRQAILKDKKERQNTEAEEEKFFRDYMKKEYEKKKEREDREKRQRFEQRMKLKKSIGEQVSVLEKKRNEKKIREAREAEVLKRQWEIEEQNSIKKKMLERQKEIERNDVVNLFNQMKRKMKEEEALKEHELDLKVIKDALEKEEAEERAEREKKEMLKQKQKDYQNMLLKQMEKERIDESELDNLRKRESERLYQKRVDQWEKEGRARRKLQEECMKENQRMLNRHKLVGEEVRYRKMEEREKVTEDVSSYLNEEKEKLDDHFKNNQKHRKFILKQIEEKKVRDKGNSVKEMKEVEKNRKMLEDYEKKLKERLQQLETTKPKGYQHINVAKYRRFY